MTNLVTLWLSFGKLIVTVFPEGQDVQIDALAADELWSNAWKKQKHCLPDELEAGDCLVALSLAQLSGLILTLRVGKHTDSLAQELVTSTEGKTNCKEGDTNG
jgi:hypothetical protein